MSIMDFKTSYYCGLLFFISIKVFSTFDIFFFFLGVVGRFCFRFLLARFCNGFTSFKISLTFFSRFISFFSQLASFLIVSVSEHSFFSENLVLENLFFQTLSNQNLKQNLCQLARQSDIEHQFHMPCVGFFI